jgi:heptosyltransferase II
VNRILVMRFRALGDVLLATPLLRALKRRWPDARLDYLVEESLAPLLEGSEDLDRILAWPRRAKPRWLSDLRWAFRLRRERYDMVIDLHGSTASVLFTAFSRASHRLGYKFRGRHFFYTQKIDRAWPEDLPPAYEPRRHFRLLESLGIEAEDLDLRLPPRSPSEFLGPADTRRILIAPGATWSAKAWPAKHYAAIIRELASEGSRLYLMGSPGEQDLLRQIAADAPAEILPATSLETMLDAIAAADLLLCTDSGSRHVAVALGTPSLALFGPSDPRVWSPVDPRHPFIHEQLDCMPCMLTECPIEGHPCMNGLTPERVIARIRQFWIELEGP